jgi:O-antigen/teichoic acid export membrane protein
MTLRRWIGFARRWTGIDGAIGFTLLSKVVSSCGSLLTLFFIASFLSPDEQGYYYTFGSIVAIQVFFELGFNNIITQYAAYELAHLKWDSPTALSGSAYHLSRLSSLLHFCMKLFGGLGVGLFVALEICGDAFFSHFGKSSAPVAWQLPWALVAFSTSVIFFANPLLAFVAGLGKVREVAMIRFWQQVVNVLCVIVVLVFGGKLWALGIASLAAAGVILGGIAFSYRGRLLAFLYRARGADVISYWREVFPYQWKISLSWISGYFIFQLFNPVIFATEGARTAGQMGMTLTVLTGISSLSISWITTKIPAFSTLIALTRFDELDRLFNRTFRQLLLVNLAMLLLFSTGVYALGVLGIGLATRFLEMPLLLLMCSATFFNQFAFSWATYLRCHKQEPYLVNSLVTGALTALSTLLMGRHFGVLGVASGYAFIILFVCTPWGLWIFNSKKRQWHAIRVTPKLSHEEGPVS